jgi:hypothetical protein
MFITIVDSVIMHSCIILNIMIVIIVILKWIKIFQRLFYNLIHHFFHIIKLTYIVDFFFINIISFKIRFLIIKIITTFIQLVEIFYFLNERYSKFFFQILLNLDILICI